MKTIAALIATAALAAPAFAGGPVKVADEPAVAAPVAAPYVAPGLDWSGPYVGAQIGYGNVDSNGAGRNGNDWFGGVNAGYRWDFGNWVAGTELSYDATNIALGPVAGDELSNVLALKLQAGREIGNSLVYGSLGAAQANATVGGVDLRDTGFIYGVGFDYALGNLWTVGGEVVQHNFNSFDGTPTDFDATTIKAKVGLRF